MCCSYKPFSGVCVRHFTKQLVHAIDFLHSMDLIHTDLKLENILLADDAIAPMVGEGGSDSERFCPTPQCTVIKVIDFGGATFEHEHKSEIVNTRQV